MFAKPYKHKSNNTLKNSEKKHLVQRVLEEFNLYSEEKAKELIPSKATCICMKLVLHSGEYVNVYAVDGVPTLIETSEFIIPTVCALWKLPGLVPTLTVHSPVLPKIQNGAPLYLPGVSIPAEGRGFPLFHAGTILAANTGDNSAACLVGRATMSSADMLLRTTGVCMDILQVYGDQLCKDDKFTKIDRPKLAPNTGAAPTEFTFNLAADIQKMSLQPVKEEWPALGQPAPTPLPVVPNEPKLITEETPEPEHIESIDEDNDPMDADLSETENNIPTDMDGLLRWCLLGFLKLDGKNAELPIKTNFLYKNLLHPLCPPDRVLDVKKSSYKKLGKFLEAMQEEGLVEIRETERGVWAVTGVRPQHPAVRGHRVDRPPPPQAAAPPPNYEPPQVREVLCVTAAVVELLAPVKKGTALTHAEVRAAVTEYVKNRDLTSRLVKGAVTLDPLLAKIVGKPEQECVKWDALMAGVATRMTVATEMVFADGVTTLTKARLEPVKMAVVTRSGNKKVTLVSNLESFGFRLAALAGAWQRGAAGAVRVTRTPGSRADQLMLQGDQTHFVAKILIEKYGLPKKFVEGADKALNKKR